MGITAGSEVPWRYRPVTNDIDDDDHNNNKNRSSNNVIIIIIINR